MSANSCCSGGVTAPCVWQWQLLPAEVAGALLYLERSSRWSVSTEQLVKVIQPQRHKNNNEKKQLTSGGRQDPLYIRSGSCCLFNGMNSTTPDERRPRREKAVCVDGVWTDKGVSEQETGWGRRWGRGVGVRRKQRERGGRRKTDDVRGEEKEEQRGGRHSVCFASQEESAATEGQWTAFTAGPNEHRAASSSWNTRYGWRLAHGSVRAVVLPALKKLPCVCGRGERLQEGSDAAQQTLSGACVPAASGSWNRPVKPSDTATALRLHRINRVITAALKHSRERHAGTPYSTAHAYP